MKTENMDLNIRTKTQSNTNIKSKLNHFLLETLHIFSNNNHYVNTFSNLVMVLSGSIIYHLLYRA